MPRDEVDAIVASYKLRMGDIQGEDGYELKEADIRPFVDQSPFNIGMGVVIATNAVLIGLEVDAKSVGESRDAATWLGVEIVFCAIFTIELGLRLYFHRCHFWLMPGMQIWNALDTIIVVMSLFDIIVLTPLGSDSADLNFVQLIRFARLARLVRLVRLFRIFKELWLVASGLLESLKTLFWVCIIIFFLCYVFAIFLTVSVQQAQDSYDTYYLTSGFDHKVYFGSVMRSVLSLLQVLTFSAWSDEIARHLIKQQPWQFFVLLVFVALGSWGLLNVVIGVVVENALRTSEADRNFMAWKKDRDRQLVLGQLQEIFEFADVNDSGTLDIEEVENALAKPEVYSKLKMIDFPVDDPQHLFRLLDYDDSGELTIDEFITGCLRMKGSAQSKDLLAAQVALDTMRKHYVTFERELGLLNEQLHGLHKISSALTDQGERVFLSMQEYRIRHTHLPATVTNIPQLSEDELGRSPWEEGQHEYASPTGTNASKRKGVLMSHGDRPLIPGIVLDS